MVSTNKKQQFGETQPLLEQALCLSQYAQEDEGETEIGNGSQFAEQGEGEEDEGTEFAKQGEDEGTQECIATIDIKEPTSQNLEEFRQSTKHGTVVVHTIMPCLSSNKWQIVLRQTRGSVAFSCKDYLQHIPLCKLKLKVILEM
jgi:hypothetical protein